MPHPETSSVPRLAPGPAALAAVCAGVMASVAMPPFQGTGWLIVPALALLFAVVTRAGHPARLGWLFGVAHQASLLHWLFLLGPEAPIASRVLVPVMAGAAILYVSLYYLLFGWLVGRAARLGAGLTAAPLLWTGVEILRGVGELGFPWCLSGAAILQTPLYPLAAAGGEAALGAGAAFAAAALVAVSDLRGVRDGRVVVTAVALGAAALAFWGLLALAGRVPVDAEAPTVRTAVIQPDVALRDKWAKGRLDSTTVPYTALTHEAVRGGAEFVVWAETSVPAYLMYERELAAWVQTLADSNHVHLLVGFPDANAGPDGRRVKTNACGLFGPNGYLHARYHKHHLLPFGERVPFQSLCPALGELDFGQAEWHAGERPHPMSVPAGPGRCLDIAPLICFESIFGPSARAAVAEGASVLVNITNDGWFGHTAGPVQHAALSRLRAAECGVPVIRCANNGVSLVTDARGRVRERLGLGVRDLILIDVAPGPGDTFYVRHGSKALGVALAAWALIVIGLIFWRRR